MLAPCFPVTIRGETVMDQPLHTTLALLNMGLALVSSGYFTFSCGYVTNKWLKCAYAGLAACLLTVTFVNGALLVA